MKNSLTPLLLLVFIISTTAFYGCKKKDEKPEFHPPAPANIVCEGNGQNTFLPLAFGNKWSWGSGNYWAGTSSRQIAGTDTIINNHIYYIMKNDWIVDGYYRADASGNVYRFYNNADMLYMSANPYVGQSFAQGTVVEINASAQSSSCSYTGCVKVQGSIIEYHGVFFYYKKGIGMVKYGDEPNGDKFYLYAIELH